MATQVSQLQPRNSHKFPWARELNTSIQFLWTAPRSHLVPATKQSNQKLPHNTWIYIKRTIQFVNCMGFESRNSIYWNFRSATICFRPGKREASRLGWQRAMKKKGGWKIICREGARAMGLVEVIKSKWKYCGLRRN